MRFKYGGPHVPGNHTLDYLRKPPQPDPPTQGSIPTFGELLRFARKAAGVSQRALAKLLGVSAPYLSDVERDRRAPLTAGRTVKAARRLGIPLLAEVKARAVSDGFFALPANRDDAPGMIAGGLLALAWRHLSPGQLSTIEEEARDALLCAGVDPERPPV
jgi:transcriptional regulator with XRE-family HTH domain